MEVICHCRLLVLPDILSGEILFMAQSLSQWFIGVAMGSSRGVLSGCAASDLRKQRGILFHFPFLMSYQFNHMLLALLLFTNT